MLKNGSLLKYAKPIVLGAATYLLYKWFVKPAVTSGFGAPEEDSPAYDRLNDLRKSIDDAMTRYNKLQGDLSEYDIMMQKSAEGYAGADSNGQLTIRANVLQTMRDRDKAMLEMGLLGRMIGTLRQQIVAESARLKAAAIGPNIDIRRESLGGLGALSIPDLPASSRRRFFKDKADLARIASEYRRRRMAGR